MTQEEVYPFRVGERVKVVTNLPMATTGEQGRITALHRDGGGHLVSLTVLIDHDFATTRGITVLPHEIASEETQDTTSLHP